MVADDQTISRYLFQKRRGTVEALPVDEWNLAILVV